MSEFLDITDVRKFIRACSITMFKQIVSLIMVRLFVMGRYISLMALVAATMFLVSGEVIAQEGVLLHSGSMCSLAGPQNSEQCLELGGWGAYNSCNKAITIICPVLVPKGMSNLGGDVDVVAVDTYGQNVRARVIWQSLDNFDWQQCPQTTSSQEGFNELHPRICNDALGQRYLSIEVVLPSHNTRVYGYHIAGILQ